MKTPEEIKELAEEYYPLNGTLHPFLNNMRQKDRQQGFVDGYNQCLLNNWIDVYDRFPKQLQDVIAFSDTTIEVCTFDDGFYTTHDIQIPFVKYWMPIPETPKL